jgi:hypothetical protein
MITHYISRCAAAALFALPLMFASATAQEGRVKQPQDLGVLPTFLTAGQFDPNGKVPAIDGITGAGVHNLDVAFPQAVLVHGGFYVYLFATQNTTFSGKCTSSYKLTQVQGGKTVTLDSAVLKKNFACTPGSYYAWDLTGKAIPNSPGLATLTGTITFGGNKVTMTTVMRIV